MILPVGYKRQSICRACTYSQFISTRDYDGSEDDRFCNKHKCVIDDNGICRDYKEDK